MEGRVPWELGPSPGGQRRGWPWLLLVSMGFSDKLGLCRVVRPQTP